MSRDRRLLVTFFFLSGACSLCYEVVWLRLAFAAFGVNTGVVSVVLSVFMAGLGLGAWLGGRWTTRNPLLAYALAEALIGCGALAVPHMFDGAHRLLLGLGPRDSLPYLLWSAVLLSASLLPWCVAMGATFPLAMGFARRARLDEGGEFGLLYAANVLGAATGTLATALVLIEVHGVRGTGRLAALVNLAIALAAGWRAFTPVRGRPAPRPASRTAPGPAGSLPALFVTGAVAMAMEVAWVRQFTPVLGTAIYAFAAILAVYLLATWAGAAAYRRRRAAGRPARSSAELLTWAMLAAPLPVLLGDPAFGYGPVACLAAIVPFCAALGGLTPALIDGAAAGDPRAAGRAYAVNILGCMFGPLVASYALLPWLGSQWTIALLALPLALVRPRSGRRPALDAVTAGLVLAAMFGSHSYDRPRRDARPNTVIRRDATATVVSSGTGRDRDLFVNGVGITAMAPVTKRMAHLPMLLLERTPERVLVICLGMGTTFRSMTSWGVRTTAVELVPGVEAAFGDFFPDGPALLADARFDVVIDDGRRYLARTRDVFDVITLDPPPPVEAAGSSLLYSREFYEASRARMAPGGILAQWFPGGDPVVLRATLRALVNVFPHVRVFQSCEGWGVHLLASLRPIRLPDAAVLQRRLPAAARRDLFEWPLINGPRGFKASLVGTEGNPDSLLGPDPALELTDDRPVNEYFLVRRWLAADRRAPAP